MSPLFNSLISVNPINPQFCSFSDSTRSLYQNKLQVILQGGDANGANDSVESAGSNGEVEEETEVKTTTPRVSAKAATPKSVTPRVSQRSTRSTRVSTRYLLFLDIS